MSYLIEVTDWNTESGEAPEGYSVFDYLPLSKNGDWLFATEDEAYAYLVSNYKGSDCDGVHPRFRVIPSLYTGRPT